MILVIKREIRGLRELFYGSLSIPIMLFILMGSLVFISIWGVINIEAKERMREENRKYLSSQEIEVLSCIDDATSKTITAQHYSKDVLREMKAIEFLCRQYPNANVMYQRVLRGEL